MTPPTKNPIAPSAQPSSLTSSSSLPAPQPTPTQPKPDIRPFDRISYAITSANTTDDSKRTYRTAKVLHVKESEIIAVEEGVGGAIVRLRWSEVLPPF